MKTIPFLAVLALAAMLGACGSKSDGTLQGYAQGEYVRVAALAAQVTYISPPAEYTPPVIYSRETLD